MMITLNIEPSAKSLGLDNAVACKIDHVTVVESSKNTSALNEDYLASLLNRTDSVLSSNEVKGFRALFQLLGYPNITPAGERLLLSFKENGFKYINNVVDSYNAASLTFGCGLGLHDWDEMFGSNIELVVRRAKGNESIRPLFRNRILSIPAGDLIYGVDDEHSKVAAWLGVKDVDADDFRITEKTRSLLLVALGNSVTTREYNKAACDLAYTLIRKTCPRASITFLPLSN